MFKLGKDSIADLKGELGKLEGKELAHRVLLEVSKLYTNTAPCDEDEAAESMVDSAPKDLSTYAAKLSKNDSISKILPGDLLKHAANVRAPKSRWDHPL